MVTPAIGFFLMKHFVGCCKRLTISSVLTKLFLTISVCFFFFFDVSVCGLAQGTANSTVLLMSLLFILNFPLKKPCQSCWERLRPSPVQGIKTGFDLCQFDEKKNISLKMFLSSLKRLSIFTYVYKSLMLIYTVKYAPFSHLAKCSKYVR